MKLLQVVNVSNLLGGTFACAFTISRALPDFQHLIIAISSCDRGIDNELSRVCGFDVVRKTRILPADFDSFNPDVVIFHNTPPHLFPNYVPEDVVTFFYSHSAVMMTESRNRSLVVWAVSRWLAEKVNIGYDFVVHQPVPLPPGSPNRGETLRIGRLCTPTNSKKWRLEEIVPLYTRLSKVHTDVQWEFVGCPEPYMSQVAKCCQGRVVFHDASWDARSLLWEWDAMLYDSLLEESYGRVVCESQRCGCIPIVSHRGGFIEQIQNGQDGFLCDGVDKFDYAIGYVKDGERLRYLRESAMQSGDVRGSLSAWRRKFLATIHSTVEVMGDSRRSLPA